MTIDLKVKSDIHQHCLAEIRKKIALCEAGMREAQESANNETKSSAGDKYETGRAMAQLEKDKYATQLSEARKLYRALDNLDPAKVKSKVEPGALVYTDSGNYYLSVSVGKIIIDENVFFAISPLTPLAKSIINKTIGETGVFRGKNIKILKIK
ncbi:3-oxoacyl-ACP synthase [Mangrovivirga sp. M17]|uniref:3-oxoacyl-ACP synthase n=1 Tax=Mangrovivirga halotolerans TaxID=2993936 RepID=A0ABT3RPT5_9BACT|nr:3-oxoacyl-ACP synthase [Mangrovivirga halotolerans]MCX2743272.1 3-oxoacyl-ACP synthase [Mangrovivirga halotolerans]